MPVVLLAALLLAAPAGAQFIEDPRFEPLNYTYVAFTNPPPPSAPPEFRTPVGVDEITQTESQGRLLTQVLVADAESHHVSRLGFGLSHDFGAAVVSVLSRFGGFGTGNGQFRHPFDVAVSFDGRSALIADTANHRIQWHDIGGRVIETFADPGFGPDQVRSPMGAATDRFTTIVANTGDNRVQFWDQRGIFGGYLRAFNRRAFDGPMGADVDEQGNVGIADTGNNRVVGQMQPLGASVRLPFSAEVERLHRPADVALGPAGSFYVLNSGRDEVLKFRLTAERDARRQGARGSQSARLVPEGVLGQSGSGPGQFRNPLGIARGDRGFLYVADTGNNRIQVFQNARCRRALAVRSRMVSLFPRARRAMAAAVSRYRAGLRRGDRGSATRAARQYFRARRVAAGAARRYFAAGRVVRTEC